MALIWTPCGSVTAIVSEVNVDSHASASDRQSIVEAHSRDITWAISKLRSRGLASKDEALKRQGMLISASHHICRCLGDTVRRLDEHGS